MLIFLSLSFTVISDNSKHSRQISPLFGIRTRRAIRVKIVDFIKTRFIGKRVFWLPIPLFKKHDYIIFRDLIRFKSTCEYITCHTTSCRQSSLPEYCMTVYYTCVD